MFELETPFFPLTEDPGSGFLAGGFRELGINIVRILQLISRSNPDAIPGLVAECLTSFIQ